MDEMENKEQLQAQEEAQTPEIPQEPEKDVYVPRPAWQVWGARVALVLFIAVILLYMIKIARGGL